MSSSNKTEIVKDQSDESLNMLFEAFKNVLSNNPDMPSSSKANIEESMKAIKKEVVIREITFILKNSKDFPVAFKDDISRLARSIAEHGYIVLANSKQIAAAREALGNKYSHIDYLKEIYSNTDSTRERPKK